MKTNSSMHPRRRAQMWLPSIAVFAAIVLVPLAGLGVECEVLGEEVVFVDTKGVSVDADSLDTMALRQVGTTVTVYERTPASAAALVSDLASAGESDLTLLDANAWLLAQAPACKTRPGGGCTGVCPGKQSCKQVKKPGKNICQCMLR